jgi:hypothetical protein
MAEGRPASYVQIQASGLGHPEKERFDEIVRSLTNAILGGFYTGTTKVIAPK